PGRRRRRHDQEPVQHHTPVAAANRLRRQVPDQRHHHADEHQRGAWYRLRRLRPGDRAVPRWNPPAGRHHLRHVVRGEWRGPQRPGPCRRRHRRRARHHHQRVRDERWRRGPRRLPVQLPVSRWSALRPGPGGRRASGALHAFGIHRLDDHPTDRSTTEMTTLSLPRPRRIRPLAILVASAALVAASQVATLLQARTAPGAAPQDRPVVAGPIAPIEAPVANAPGSLERIDHSISAWTANLAANDKDFFSATNLAILYESRARLSGDVTDY